MFSQRNATVKSHDLQLTVRDAQTSDAPELCDLLNAIIRIGGTTAFETPFGVALFTEQFLAGPRVMNCLVAEDESTRRLWGFQLLERDPELPADWADIATFARAEPKVPGIGAALFAATAKRARELGLRAINATIRADNRGGLAFYGKMGFEDYKMTQSVPLKDGTPVDRLSKRYWVR
ncbi:MAG TPA: GNAT family N-acetyltransferase [Candidatus Bathyarchaeia archaeon]|nr:GNAT family N-acetyltransferase [Candidatus Bathyarchaeia archaeon]